MSNSLEAISLQDSPFPKIKVHATVIFSILNSFVRRAQRDSRIIGTLLGEVNEKDGTVTISDCFAVPYSERVDEFYVAINQEYHKTMYAFHRRNNKKEVILGWYTTSTANGEFIIDNSSLIHDFYCNECADSPMTEPIHLVVDTTLMGEQMSVRGFSRRILEVGEHQLANAFFEVAVDVELTEAETTCLYHMINGQVDDAKSSGDEEASSSSKWAKSDIMSTVPTSTESVETSMASLQKVLVDIQRYVDGVVDGSIAPNREAGTTIADALHSFTSTKSRLDVSSVQLQLQAKVRDLLMVSYLSTLTQTQTSISEKLNEIL
jgi:translation initiation factor 3 subunit F